MCRGFRVRVFFCVSSVSAAGRRQVWRGVAATPRAGGRLVGRRASTRCGGRAGAAKTSAQTLERVHGARASCRQTPPRPQNSNNSHVALRLLRLEDRLARVGAGRIHGGAAQAGEEGASPRAAPLARERCAARSLPLSARSGLTLPRRGAAGRHETPRVGRRARVGGCCRRPGSLRKSDGRRRKQERPAGCESSLDDARSRHAS